MAAKLKYIDVVDATSPDGGTRKYATVYSRYRKLITEIFPVDKFGIIMEPVTADSLSFQPAAGAGGMKVEVISLETGKVVRNAFAMRLTDPTFDLHGVSRIQTDALRNLLKVCGLADDEGLEDEIASASEAGFLPEKELAKAKASSARKTMQVVENASEDTPVQLKGVPEPTEKPAQKKRGRTAKSKVPDYKKPSRSHERLVSQISSELGLSRKDFRECEDQDEIKAMIRALMTAKKMHHKGEDFYGVIAAYRVQNDAQ